MLVVCPRVVRLIGGGVAMGGLRLVKAAVNNFDDAGCCASLATKLWQGGCFVAGTQVAVSQLPYSPSRASALWSETDWLDDVVQFAEQPNSSLQATASIKTLDSHQLSIPIEQVPLGARIPTKNPKPWERDDSLPEPDQASWAKLSITMYRTDGDIVDAELIRPRSWIKSVGIEAGKLLPMNIEELQVKGSALVTSIDDCPEIAGSSQPAASARDLGSVVTARFCTREVHTVARVEILGPEGSIETITGTTIHPVWSEDKQDWVPLGELSPGEHLRCLGEGAASDASYGLVLSVTILNQAVPVYNIEVHGEHVYQVGELGLLVHNACSVLRSNMIKAGQIFETGEQAAHIVPRNGWAWADELGLPAIIENLRNVGLIDEAVNGFRATSGHLGTHSKEYVKVLVNVMGDRTSPERPDGGHSSVVGTTAPQSKNARWSRWFCRFQPTTFGWG